MVKLQAKHRKWKMKSPMIVRKSFHINYFGFFFLSICEKKKICLFCFTDSLNGKQTQMYFFQDIEISCGFFEHTLSLEHLNNLFPLSRISIENPKNSRGLNKVTDEVWLFVGLFCFFFGDFIKTIYLLWVLTASYFCSFFPCWSVENFNASIKEKKILK